MVESVTGEINTAISAKLIRINTVTTNGYSEQEQEMESKKEIEEEGTN